ncbi:hypothetical protein [Pedobacter heparinus]|uniref:hypothetical protein n=1 Tax=Pedobacter heparinus TaxID=984 RepID=UPI00292D3591|nr:hypothetical protein [Pedobacter heparinus]
MKRLIIIFIATISLFSCKSEDQALPATGTICVINAVTDAGAIKVNSSAKNIAWSSQTTTTAYLARGFYYATEGNPNLIVVPALDTNAILFNASRAIKSKVYTMYLSGTKVAVDTIFREEIDFPYIVTDVRIPSSADSVVNVRFVNLSIGSPALKIKLATGTGNEADNLPYKGISTWKGYPARLATTVYSFQVRNAATDALITTFNFSATATNRFKSVALLIRGVFGTTTGSATFGVTAVNYF